MTTSTGSATRTPPTGGDEPAEPGRPAAGTETGGTGAGGCHRAGADTAASASLARAPLRRLPAQQRSMVRVQRMLDACAELLDEGGYSELSTTRIAERAGVAIGSVYQFFPDKKAITQALGLRYLDMFTARLRERLAEGTREHWTQAADVIIDEYLAMHRTVPGFRSLHFGDTVDTRLLDSGSENNRVIATRIRLLLTSIGGAGESEEVDRAVLVAVEAADAVLKLAFRSDADGDPRLIEEAKLLLRNYLGNHFG
ncbi:TetR family transcriptional regulator [Streptomonospora sediminis]